jgi:hypothetical protein
VHKTNPNDAARTYQVRVSAPQALRIEALCERYPHKCREELLVDLLNLGLDQVQQLWPHAVAGEAGFAPEAGQVVYLPTGPFDEFHGLAPKHHDTRLAPESAPPGLPLNP